MTPIWVVYGEQGEYSDHQVWIVAACTSEEAAGVLVARCHAWYDEHRATLTERHSWEDAYKAAIAASPDPYGRADGIFSSSWGSSPSWGTVKVSILDEIPGGLMVPQLDDRVRL